MPHPSTRSNYTSLIERLNRFPQGAPPSELLYKILALMVNEHEAGLLGQLPVLPFTAAKASHIWGMREVEAARILEGFADRALLLDVLQHDEKLYVLPPPMRGFFEFSMMRSRSDIDQESLSELLFQYLNLEGAFIKELHTGETKLGRIFVGEGEIPTAHVTQVYDYERASEVVKNAWRIGISTCYCRHKMKQLNRACSADLEMCMTFDHAADSLIRHGHAREIDSVECLDLLQKAREQNLIQFGENVREGVSFICNCCSCCCESLIAARKLGEVSPIHSTNFFPQLQQQYCNGCGRCVDACPVEALHLISANEPLRQGKRKCVIDVKRCIGCGVCVRVCQCGALSLVPKPERVPTPVDTAHRIVLMAIERDKLQHLIWDNNARTSHRIISLLMGLILKLSPVKQSLVKKQLGSRYLDLMIKRRRERLKREIQWL
ncbi:4Fe-4S dicluster domain-containing protein [Geomesophilobacter sediminis]|uniref:4Fe-4S binding protein n=1 Tax=Geomesophilobacter sediminis TaxID=2798584 RepID=A0A8J7IQ89_9BACT|nr:4Fe-4S binding protein [Geomesophilobacter sediminis]MBJ6725973.1 4Fe-4S binding protein [Geomesophilobacter sediminis]